MPSVAPGGETSEINKIKILTQGLYNLKVLGGEQMHRNLHWDITWHGKRGYWHLC